MKQPLTAEQQQLVLRYRKIARDHARYWSAGYRRLISVEDAESLADLSLCRAAPLYDPRRAGDFWCLAKIAVRTDLYKTLNVEMRRAAGRVALRQSRDDEGPTAEPIAPVAGPELREQIRDLAEWASADPERTAAIERAARGQSLSPADVEHLADLRALLGLPPLHSVPAAEAAAQLRLTGRSIRRLFARGQLAGHKRGAAIWVHLPAAP